MVLELLSNAYEYEETPIVSSDRVELPRLLTYIDELPQSLTSFGNEKKKIIQNPKGIKVRYVLYCIVLY